MAVNFDAGFTIEIYEFFVYFEACWKDIQTIYWYLY